MMRLILVTFILTQIHFAKAADTAFEACESLPVMAVLAKDNFPYWTTPVRDNNTDQVEQCYELVVDVANFGTPSDLDLLQNELNGQLKVFKSDADFSKFVTEQVEFEQMKIETPKNVRPHLVPLTTSQFQFLNKKLHSKVSTVRCICRPFSATTPNARPRRPQKR